MNVSQNNLTFRFVVDGVDRTSLTYSCNDINIQHTVFIVAIEGECYRSDPQPVTFTISDLTPPAFDIIPNRDFILDDNGSIIIYPSDLVKNASDNCNEREITFWFVVGGVDRASLTYSCDNIGSQTVQIVAIDASGNRSPSQTVTFSIVDQTPIPDFDVISNQHIFLDNAGRITVHPIDFVTNISGNDITFRFVVNGADVESLLFSCADIGLQRKVSIVAIAETCKRSQPKEVTFAIGDQTPPVARCKPATLYLDGDGKSTLTATMIDYGSADNCGIASRQIKKTSDSDEQYAHSLDFNRNDLEISEDGIISVTLRVSDASGNEATCTSEVRLIERIELPEIGDIPGIFTPNGDGFNDTWEISGIDQYPEAIIRIYNRAKKLLVELKGAQIPWDGKDGNGNLLESGYYFYQIELRRGGNIISGYVTILK